MDYLSLIKQPIGPELSRYGDLFSASLEYKDGLLAVALDHIKQRTGKRMRPMLILLIAKNYGKVSEVTLNAAVGLELLHTASLIHDDVVDNSPERRAQPSVNALYDNKVAVLVGDYLLSTALHHISATNSTTIAEYFATVGKTLASGEILQLSNIHRQDFSEDAYYEVIKLKTAALFEACCVIGALSSGASDLDIQKARSFGQNLGIIFQIRDDVFDYFDSPEIGKPTGNDLSEGKLTLPVIYALNSTKDPYMLSLSSKVKNNTVSHDEIIKLVEFTKENGGIEYAEKRMLYFRNLCASYLNDEVSCPEIKQSLSYYLDFVIKRES